MAIGKDPRLAEFQPGDRVEYIMSKCPSVGRMETWYLPATVVKVGKCLVIRVDRWPKRTRNTTPSMVRKIVAVRTGEAT